MPNINKSECCSECVRWDAFEHKCWFFWENKKECTQKAENNNPQNNNNLESPLNQ